MAEEIEQVMDLLEKPYILNSICGIEIDASATYLPSPVGSLQPFDNTYVATRSARPVYFGKASVSLSQEGKKTKAGMLYQQEITLRFPNGDLLSAKRIRQYISAKFLYIKLSGGVVHLFGRNDYFQNARPKIKIKNDPTICEVSYTVTSMFPIGLTNGSNDGLLPEDLPINFYNL